MKAVLFSALVATVAGTQAFALQDTQCSNATGSLKRVEQEIFGANPVDWVIRGVSVRERELNVRELSKTVIKPRESEEQGTETYVALVEVSRKDGGALPPLHGGFDLAQLSMREYVVCEFTFNDMQD